MSKCWYKYKGIGGCILRYALTHRLLTRYFLMSWCYCQPSVLTPHVYPLTDKMYTMYVDLASAFTMTASKKWEQEVED